MARERRDAVGLRPPLQLAASQVPQHVVACGAHNHRAPGVEAGRVLQRDSLVHTGRQLKGRLWERRQRVRVAQRGQQHHLAGRRQARLPCADARQDLGVGWEEMGGWRAGGGGRVRARAAECCLQARPAKKSGGGASKA
jgi:hypothetical protein